MDAFDSTHLPHDELIGRLSRELLRTVGLRLSIEVETNLASCLERPVRGRPKKQATIDKDR